MQWDTRPGKHTKNDGKIQHAINGKIHYNTKHIPIIFPMFFRDISAQAWLCRSRFPFADAGVALAAGLAELGGAQWGRCMGDGCVDIRYVEYCCLCN
jgi:hypothetical protein